MCPPHLHEPECPVCAGGLEVVAGVVGVGVGVQVAAVEPRRRLAEEVLVRVVPAGKTDEEAKMGALK